MVTVLIDIMKTLLYHITRFIVTLFESAVICHVDDSAFNMHNTTYAF